MDWQRPAPLNAAELEMIKAKTTPTPFNLRDRGGRPSKFFHFFDNPSLVRCFFPVASWLCNQPALPGRPLPQLSTHPANRRRQRVYDGAVASKHVLCTTLSFPSYWPFVRPTQILSLPYKQTLRSKQTTALDGSDCLSSCMVTQNHSHNTRATS